ncbi:MAG: hypothetical protein ABIR36_00765 [Nitrospiraceae bacterium]
MSQLFPESPLQFLPNDVLAEKEAVSQGTDTIQQPFLSSPDSGMIVFSSSARILHMNGPARALMALFGDSHELWPQMAPESMPSFLTEFCRDVLAQLHRRVETEDWAQFEMRRICHMITPSLLLRGFGVPYSANHELRIILTLDPLLSLPHPGNSPAHLQPLAPMPIDHARTHA